MVMVFLKLDKIVKFTWQVAIWPIWVFLALDISFFVFTAMLFFYCVYLTIIKWRYNCSVLLSSLWQCWVVLGFGLCTGFLVFDVILRYDYRYVKKGEKYELGERVTTLKASWPTYLSYLNFVGFLMINFVITLLMFKILTNWFDKIFYADDTLLNIFLTSEERR